MLYLASHDKSLYKWYVKQILPVIAAYTRQKPGNNDQLWTSWIQLIKGRGGQRRAMKEP